MADEVPSQQRPRPCAALQDYLQASKADGFYDRRGYPGVYIDEPYLLDMLKSYAVQEDALSNLSKELASNLPDPERLQRWLHVAQGCGTALKTSVEDGLGWSYIATAPTTNSPIQLHQVFGIPELAELVFAQLSARDLISTSWANRSWSQTITSSQILQKQLCLRPDVAGFWRTMFSQIRWSFEEQLLPWIYCKAEKPRDFGETGSKLGLS
jgi:hypothetical protein